jgi:hypothetical protein
MESKQSGPGNTYRITVKETLHQRVTDWYAGLTVTPQENGETLLVGRFADQPALRGFLDQLWNLNLTVLSVEKMDSRHEGDQP